MFSCDYKVGNGSKDWICACTGFNVVFSMEWHLRGEIYISLYYTSSFGFMGACIYREGECGTISAFSQYSLHSKQVH